MNSLISIIIPVYNSDEYLCRCIDSILCQSYPHFELILIDDGSTDNSLHICKSYQEKDSRIIVYSQENQGPSCARNAGISLAQGEWLTFVDSDDYVVPDYLLSFAKCITSSVLFYHQGIVSENIDGSIDFLGANESIACNASKLFHVPTIKKKHINYNEKIRHSEDLLFIIDYLKCVEKIQTISGLHYHYCRRTDSLSQTGNIDTFAQNLLLYHQLLTRVVYEPMVSYLNTSITFDLDCFVLCWPKISEKERRDELFKQVFSMQDMYRYFTKRYRIDNVIIILIRAKLIQFAATILFLHRAFFLKNKFLLQLHRK